jgi:hypothetical protein
MYKYKINIWRKLNYNALVSSTMGPKQFSQFYKEFNEKNVGLQKMKERLSTLDII